MKTVIWVDRKRQEAIVDGHRIILGFGEAVIDPVETDKVIRVEILKTKESKNFEAKHQAFNGKCIEVNNLMKDGAKAVRLRMMATEAKQPAEAAKHKAVEKKCAEDYKKAHAEAEGLQNELKDMRPVMKEVKKKLRREKAVYFEPKFGEKIISDDEFVSLMELIRDKKPDELVTVEGKVIKNPDYIKPEPVTVEG